MGLFVVGRLADRHGIRVQLRPSGEQAGTTSLVMLPEAITHGGGGEEQAADYDADFTVSRIVPEHQQATFDDRQRTAAELGFDDTRYGRPDTADMDMAGRSLMREERRAALEAQATGEQPGDGRQDFGHEDGNPLFRDQTPSATGYQDFPSQDFRPQDFPAQEYAPRTTRPRGMRKPISRSMTTGRTAVRRSANRTSARAPASRHTAPMNRHSRTNGPNAPHSRATSGPKRNLTGMQLPLPLTRLSAYHSSVPAPHRAMPPR